MTIGVTLTLLSSFMVSVQARAGVPADGNRQILVLVGPQYGLPMVKAITPAIVDTFLAAGVSMNDIFVEFLDLYRGPETAHRGNLLTLLETKLRDKRIGLILAVNQGAVDFLAREGRPLFPDAPLIIPISEREPASMEPARRSIIVLASRQDAAGTLRYAFGLFPRTRRAVIVMGKDDTRAPFYDVLQEALAGLAPGLPVEDTAGLTYEEMLRHVASLPGDTIAFYGSYFEDVTGRSFVPAEVAGRVAATASVPVFAFRDMHIVQGLVGGSVADTARLGRQAARAGIDYLDGRLELHRQRTIIEVANVPLFDWQQLRRWRADPGRLPDETVFLNRVPPLWETHRQVIIGTGSLIVLLLLLVVTLLTANRKEKAFTTAIREKDAQLEHANRVLKSIRNVNQLIVRESDPAVLVRRAVAILVETRGYLAALIVVTDGRGVPVDWSQRGFGAGFAAMEEYLRAGKLPPCHEACLASENAHLVEHEKHCAGCPLPPGCASPLSLSARLDCKGTFHGLLAVNLPREFRHDAEERSLVEEMAGDIAYALHQVGEEAKRRSVAELNRSIVSVIPDIIIRTNREGVYLDVLAAAAADKLILPGAKLRGRKIKAVLPGKIAALVMDALGKAFETRALQTVEYRLETPRGQRYFEARIIPADDDTAVALIRDITGRRQAEAERKTLHAQLAQVEKLAALGELVAGVAHEISNPLTGMIGLSELLVREQKTHLDAETREDIESIYQAARRIRKIVDNLLRFARQEKPMRRRTSIGGVMDAVLSARKHELESGNIRVEKNCRPGLPDVMADPSQVEQVFLNLVINAEHAMLETGRGGTLAVNIFPAENRPAGQKIVVEIADTGPGIPADALEKVFDPFFTTKPVGKGTGLGLSVSYGIIREHGGEISAGNRQEGGAVFTVTLPVHGGNDGEKKASRGDTGHR